MSNGVCIACLHTLLGFSRHHFLSRLSHLHSNSRHWQWMSLSHSAHFLLLQHNFLILLRHFCLCTIIAQKYAVRCTMLHLLKFSLTFCTCLSTMLQRTHWIWPWEFARQTDETHCVISDQPVSSLPSVSCCISVCLPDFFSVCMQAVMFMM